MHLLRLAPRSPCGANLRRLTWTRARARAAGNTGSSATCAAKPLRAPLAADPTLDRSPSRGLLRAPSLVGRGRILGLPVQLHRGGAAWGHSLKGVQSLGAKSGTGSMAGGKSRACASSAAGPAPEAAPAGGQGLGIGASAERSPWGTGPVVDVVRGNFEELLPAVRDAFAECHVVALDAEFTGLSAEADGAAADRVRKVELLDDLEQRYARVRASAQSFLIMQLGLSALRWDPERGAFVAHTFNFHLFPLPYKNVDVRFLSQASSLAFLAQNNFDFNKFVYQGIPYLNLQLLHSERQSLERSLRREQQQQQQRRNGAGANGSNGTGGGNGERGPLELTDPVDRLFVGKQVERVRTWLSQTEPPALGYIPPGGAAAWEGPVLELEECNSFRRAAIYQELEKEFGGAQFYAHSVRGQSQWASRIQLLRATEAQMAALEEARREQQRRELEEAGGFARVLEMLLEACHARAVPVVGHNMLLDLAYLTNQFLQPLPPSLQDFRTQVGRYFPGGIYDTKHLAASGSVPRGLFEWTSLGDVFERLTTPGVCRLLLPGDEEPSYTLRLTVAGQGEVPQGQARPAGDGAAEDGSGDASPDMTVALPPVLPSTALGGCADPRAALAGQAHDAGYDAFMTGAAFAGLCSIYPALAKIPTLADNQNMMEEREQGGATAEPHAPEAEASAGSVPASAEGPQAQDPSGTAVGIAGLTLRSSDPAATAVGATTAPPESSNGPSDMELTAATETSAEVKWIPDSVKELCNRVHVMNSTLKVLPLRGPVPAPDRAGTFLLSNLGPADNGASLQKLFLSSGLGNVTQVWLQNVPVQASEGAASGAREDAGGANGGGARARGRNGRGGEGAGAAGPSRDLTKRVMVILEDSRLGPQVVQVLSGCAPHLAVTPWDHIPAPLLHACLNAGTSFHAAWSPGPDSGPVPRQAGGRGVRARAEGGEEEARPSKALRSEVPPEGKSSCSIM